MTPPEIAADPPLRIAVAPVDWGIGHATRSSVIIDRLLARGVEVVLAATGEPLHLLSRLFPGLESAPVPAWRIRYPTGIMSLDLALQAPRIIAAIRAERCAASRLVATRRLDALISDGRLGFCAAGVPSVLVSHQLSLSAPNSFFRAAARALMTPRLARFDRIWVPDSPDQRLSGSLSDAPAGCKPTFVGPLSRFPDLPGVLPEPNDLLVLLSGPEPQRTNLERAVEEELASIPGRSVVVRGSLAKGLSASNDRIPFADADRLASLVAGAGVVLCRSGYSTIMDLDRVGARLILVPTPGQTEQVYLAERLARAGRAVVRPQSDLRLAEAIADARRLAIPDPVPDVGLLDAALDDLLEASILARRTTQRPGSTS